MIIVEKVKIAQEKIVYKIYKFYTQNQILKNKIVK